MCKRLFFVVAAVVAVCSCEKVENVGETVSAPSQEKSFVTLEDVATLFSSLRLGPEQMEEVHHAALCSVANGYDEEYRMRDVFEAPGAGVGDGGVFHAAVLHRRRTQGARHQETKARRPLNGNPAPNRPQPPPPAWSGRSSKEE